jgi:S-adenosylmethionine-diacylglycerol 3-amino-3-carboxypropyl transferase
MWSEAGRNIMSTIAAPETQWNQTGQLLKRAVQRNRLASVEGILERLFAAGFRGLVYPQIWEDPVVDMEAMRIEPHHHVVAIASGGCNVMSYLAADPARITAVDLSPAHVALLRLKIAAARNLTSWEDFYRFFGEASSAENIRAYDENLKAHLDPQTRYYWDRRTLFGRRLSAFGTGLYRKGLLGRFIAAGHAFAGLSGYSLEGLLSCRTLEEQRIYFERNIAPLFGNRILQRLTGYRASLFGLGIPPAQYEALCGGRPMHEVLLERLRVLACNFPVAENYFAWQAFGRRYASGDPGQVPPYLERRNFTMMRERSNRVDVRQASITDELAGMSPGSVDRIVLLDAQDWMTGAQLTQLWKAINRATSPGARVIFRTAGGTTVLPGRIPADMLARWTYHVHKSRELGGRDRSSIYGGFHLYERIS